MNSRIEGQVRIGEGSLVLHSHLEGNLQFGKRNLLIELDSALFDPVGSVTALPIRFPDNIVLQQVMLKFLPQKQPIPLHTSLLTVFGVSDNLILTLNDPSATFLNDPWQQFFSRTGIVAEDLWALDALSENKSLMNAKLFPIGLLGGGRVYFRI